ncbi:MJ1255/VC2487 family glycosyltransferase [uncultured Vibrio sp.]|uniref:MJ1255/VC2487 family glycosyltransferase n=1 Tax=uncultured Vibrio sp. TaxID=114054 RepID=UPI000921749E|nr:MJ1255/VC2487 family glycosyltransferase [uncultured Vibrio sp.]OIQ24297.1 MAG: glycosyltransferase [Vibrio sp. MedPE-SWchi]
MKILYGVQGTGNGHIARARAMSQALKGRGIDVDYLFSGRDAEKYFSMQEFGQYQTRKGLTFESENGQVSYLKTVKNNNLVGLYQEVAQLDLTDYDLVLNDFEPITAWAAKKQNKTCISISHQNAFRHSVPLKGANWIDKRLIHHFAPSDYAIGLHWYHFEQQILPPIVHSINYAPDSDEAQKNFILVYLPFENSNEICNLLFRFASYQFVCFHPGVNKVETIENVELRPLCHESFQSHLHRCNGVIANGGFELPSEALTLGKKLLLKPLSGQFEQQSNVATLDGLGLASSMEFLDASKVRVWLDEKPGERVVYPNVAQAIAEWVHNGKWDTQEQLCRSLWEKVDFPSYVSNL